MVGIERDHAIATRFAAVKIDAEGGFLWEWKVMNDLIMSLAQKCENC